MIDLSSLFGQIDVYLFDQLLRGRIRPGMSVLDAGCGGGRNLVFLLREAYEVYAVDPAWDSKRTAGKVTFATSPLWQRTFQSIVDMKDAGCFEPGSQGVTTTQAFTTFARGDAVMTIIATTPNTAPIRKPCPEACATRWCVKSR